jgi:hypothetical protein
MTKLAIKTWLGSLAIALVALAGCSNLSSGEGLERQSSNSQALVVSTPEPRLPTAVSTDDLDLLKRFAEEYEPKSGREVIPSPPVLNQKLSEIIARAANSDSREHEKYVVLIFLKLSRFQIEHFKQRYELGRDNPLTKEFYRLIGENNYEKAEIMLAYLADNYVEKNPPLLEYAPIKTEMRRIDKAGERIEQDLRKTEARQLKSHPNNKPR